MASGCRVRSRGCPSIYKTKGRLRQQGNVSRGTRKYSATEETNLNIALLVKMGDFRHASRLAHGSRYSGDDIVGERVVFDDRNVGRAMRVGRNVEQGKLIPQSHCMNQRVMGDRW